MFCGKIRVYITNGLKGVIILKLDYHEYFFQKNILKLFFYYKNSKKEV